jgi:hypothetical protein
LEVAKENAVLLDDAINDAGDALKDFNSIEFGDTS